MTIVAIYINSGLHFCMVDFFQMKENVLLRYKLAPIADVYLSIHIFQFGTSTSF